jgi:hypothetical protein
VSVDIAELLDNELSAADVTIKVEVKRDRQDRRAEQIAAADRPRD